MVPVPETPVWSSHDQESRNNGMALGATWLIHFRTALAGWFFIWFHTAGGQERDSAVIRTTRLSGRWPVGLLSLGISFWFFANSRQAVPTRHWRSDGRTNWVDHTKTIHHKFEAGKTLRWISFPRSTGWTTVAWILESWMMPKTVDNSSWFKTKTQKGLAVPCLSISDPKEAAVWTMTVPGQSCSRNRRISDLRSPFFPLPLPSFTLWPLRPTSCQGCSTLGGWRGWVVFLFPFETSLRENYRTDSSHVFSGWSPVRPEPEPHYLRLRPDFLIDAKRPQAS